MEQCNVCNPVTQEQCSKYRSEFQGYVDEYEDRLNQKDVADARRDGQMEVQIKLLWGIFGFVGAQFFVNLFNSGIIK